MADLDLMKPGKFVATAENEATTTFHLVVPRAGYTVDALSANPNIAPADELMSPFSVPYTEVDKDGKAIFDLKATGRDGEIMAKLTDRYEAGGARIPTVRGVVIATARDGNRIPKQQVAQITDLTLKAIPTVTLIKQIDYITVINYKNGTKEFVIDLIVTGPVTQVQLSTTPGQPIRTSTGVSGNGTITVPVQEGPRIQVFVTAPFSMSSETTQTAVPRTYQIYIPGGWRTAGGRVEYDYRTDTKENWTGGMVTLRAAGTGAYTGIVKSINLTAQSWASDWLAGPPPPPFWHNCC